MINDTKDYYTLDHIVTKMRSMKKDEIGDVYVKYLEPINLHEYLQQLEPQSDFCYTKQFDKMALRFTTDLYKKQNYETPLTLNSLLSAWLLQEKAEQIKMSELLKKAEMIYDYLQVKPWVKTYMTTKPMPDLAERHVSALGFKTKKINKRDQMINLEVKQDWRCLLILSYYSMNLIPAFLLEGCLCTIIKVEIENGAIVDG